MKKPIVNMGNEHYDIEWLIEHSKKKFKRRLCHEITGAYFDNEVIDELICHILDYKWIECEKAKKNLFGEGEEAIIKAGKDWWKKHRDEFLQENNYEIRYVRSK